MFLKTVIKKITPDWLRQFILKPYYLHKLKEYLATEECEKAEAEFSVIKNIVKEGDYVIDVGANFGFYTQYLSKLVGNNGHVHSIEPISLTYEILLNNVTKLNLNNVTVYNCAISEKNGIATMEIPKFNSGDDNFYEARIANRENGINSLRHFSVNLRTLDSLFINDDIRIAFIKIDVEGHELNVINGALKLIKNYKPALFIEVASDPDDRRSPAFKLFEQLNNNGYLPYWYDGNKLRSRNYGDKSVNYFFLNNDHIKDLNECIGASGKN